MSVDLTKVLTIAEVAAIAGWEPQRMRRHLLRVNAEVGGMLLHNVGTAERPRWTMTLGALKQAAPQWFTDPVVLEQLRDDVAGVKAEQSRHARLIATLTKTLAELIAA